MSLLQVSHQEPELQHHWGTCTWVLSATYVDGSEDTVARLARIYRLDTLIAATQRTLARGAYALRCLLLVCQDTAAVVTLSTSDGIRIWRMCSFETETPPCLEYN